MKQHGKLTVLTVCFIVCLCVLFPGRVLAAGRIDTGRDCSLTIYCQEKDKPLENVLFWIYRVADADETGELRATSYFTDYNVDIRGKNDEAWITLASTLEGLVLRDKLSPIERKKTDAGGQVRFPGENTSLKPGLYLVLASDHTQEGYVYKISPFMVILPEQNMETNTWEYDVNVSTKYSSAPESEEPETVTRKVLKVWKDTGYENDRPEKVEIDLLKDGEIYDTVTLSEENNWRYTWEELSGSSQWTVAEKKTEGYTVSVAREGITFVVTNTRDSSSPVAPSSGNSGGSSGLPAGKTGKLIQTGQLWWPVPVLMTAGLLLVICGLISRKRGKYAR